MTDLRAGPTQMFLPTLEVEGEPRGKFLAAVRQAAAGEFEILGELGRRAEGGIAYLARDLAQPRLVALRLKPNPGSRHDYVLTVLQELDGSLPAPGAGCLSCSEPLRGWGRYCHKCGLDLSGLDTSGLAGSGVGIEDLAKELTGDECRILGKMRRAEGGGMVYFAKQRGQETIVGLRLRRGEGGGYAVDPTTEITFLPDPVTPSGPPEPWDQLDGTIPSHMAPTLHADALGVPQSAGRGPKQDDRAKPLPRTSRLLAVLIVAAVLALGIVLGALLG